MHILFYQNKMAVFLPFLLLAFCFLHQEQACSKNSKRDKQYNRTEKWKSQRRSKLQVQGEKDREQLFLMPSLLCSLLSITHVSHVDPIYFPYGYHMNARCFPDGSHVNPGLIPGFLDVFY